MAVNPQQLTTQQTANLPRVKYFPMELYLANMLPNTTYDMYIGSTKVNSLAKPYGGKLGSPLKADATGKLKIQYHHAVAYNQSYLVNPQLSSGGLTSSNPTITFVDPFGKSSSTQLNITLKSS